MIRTQIQLDERQYRELKALGAQSGKGLAQQVREAEGWRLLTSNYVVQESWALIQARLGWEAVEAWHRALLARCEIIWVDETLHQLGAARCRQAGDRRLSLTDCVSFEVMHRERVREFIGDDGHFRDEGFLVPK